MPVRSRFAATLVAFSALIGLLALSEPARAQARSPRLQVTVALVDRLPQTVASDPALVVRGQAGREREIILLPAASADAESLASAVFTLLLARQLERDHPRAGGLLRVRSRTFPAAWARSEIPRAARVIERLRGAPLDEFPGIGTARALDLYLPRAHVVARLDRS